MWPRPFWLMRQAGRYLAEYRELRARAPDFLAFCYDPELAIEATLQPVRRFAPDGAILFSDILVVLDALGIPVRFVEGEGPRLEPVRARAQVPELDLDRLVEHLAPVYEALRRLRAAVPPEVALIGFAGLPWTLAAYAVEGGGSREFLQARILARRKPEAFALLIERLREAVLAHVLAQIEAGAEAVQLFDSWAGVLPEPELRRFALEPSAQIVEAIKARHPEVPVVLFPRGVGPMYRAYARDTAADALSLDTTVPLAWARGLIEDAKPRGLCLQGNLDPVALLAGGEALLAEAGRIVAALEGLPHVFNLGHGVLPETDPENVTRLAGFLRSVERP